MKRYLQGINQSKQITRTEFGAKVKKTIIRNKKDNFFFYPIYK